MRAKHEQNRRLTVLSLSCHLSSLRLVVTHSPSVTFGSVWFS